MYYDCRIKSPKIIYDDNESDSDAHSSGSTEILESSSSTVRDPPPVAGLSPVKRSNAFCMPQQDKRDNSLRNTFVGKCS